MASEKCKRPEASSISKSIEDEVDKISQLPEHMLHRILSSVPTKYATRTSALSKKFRRVWNSFPVIDFDYFYSYNFYGENGRERFLNLVHDSLERREPNKSLKKFRLHVELDNTQSDNRIDGAISFALDNNVTELDLDVHSGRNDYGLFYKFPSILFLVNSIMVLKLKGFNLENLDLTKFPSVEKLSITSCNWLKTLEVNSTAKLKSMEIESCGGLWLIDIHHSNLKSFSFKGKLTEGWMEPCEIKLAADCKSLEKLVLMRAIINCEWLNNHVSNFHLLENLTLSGCHFLQKIYIPSACLKVLEIIGCKGLEKVEIVAPNLESFVFNGEHKECDMIITACKSLTNLEMYRATVRDIWVKENVSEFPFLVNLKLFECEKLEKLEISHKELKSFQLLRCTKLVGVEIRARKLISFRYHGVVIQSALLIDSPHLEAELKLTLSFDSQSIPDGWYMELRNFLGYFDHCKLLALVCPLEEILIFPERLRESLIPPLFDIKHLKVRMDSPAKDIKSFVDSLLWLCPLLEALSIIVSGSGESSLKFQYASRGYEEEKDLSCCCHSWLIKCWRHSMKIVTMETFQNSNDKDGLREFFASESLRLETIETT